jgi:hypothetical protein
MKGTWRAGSSTGGKALEMGVYFHRAPPWGNMEGHYFLRAFERYAKMPCKRVSLSIGVLLENL